MAPLPCLQGTAGAGSLSEAKIKSPLPAFPCDAGGGAKQRYAETGKVDATKP